MFVSCLENKQAAAASFTMYRGIFNEHSTRRIDFDSRPTHKRTLRPPTAPKSTLNIRNVDTFRPPAARAPFNYRSILLRDGFYIPPPHSNREVEFHELLDLSRYLFFSNLSVKTVSKKPSWRKFWISKTPYRQIDSDGTRFSRDRVRTRPRRNFLMEFRSRYPHLEEVYKEGRTRR